MAARHKHSRTPMSKADAARIQSNADRNPTSHSATSGFARRAQSNADRAKHNNDQRSR